MKIYEIQALNFRCFEDSVFQFSSEFNLLVGANGSGKTSLLKAIVAAISTPINGLSKFSFWPLSEDSSARVALVKSAGKIRYEKCFPVILRVLGQINEVDKSWWQERKGLATQLDWDSSVYTLLQKMTVQVDQNESLTLPICAFYSAERRWKLEEINASNAVRQQDSRLDAYNSWNDAAEDLKNFESWIIAKSLERLEENSSQNSDGLEERSDYGFDELSLVNQAISQALPNSKGIRYDIRLRQLVVDWDFKEPSPFRNLSDGQRAIIGLIADIARRMCLANPHLDDRVLKETPGIVIIDELDMHLHPAWQRRIPFVLRSAFPCIQFIAASHSPQIIGELKAEEIILMRDGISIGHPERAFGLESDEVLEEIMGAASQNLEVAKILDEFRDALEDENIEKAESELNALERIVVHPVPSVVAARAALQSMKFLGEENEE
ncbi:ATP-binding protein [Variovorax sp. RO1]|uniref:AAA family ATPase n=1 Tax=Variovorax sp. RO1 TaxID=2066034 RepID=UPI000C717C21|nr:AAA family ATPase [Variovorax sp. RO1]PLC05402.1 ATP-binding protein [Variovorax sp. RO1]